MKAKKVTVEEHVADMGVAVDVGLRAGVPQLVEPGVVLDVQLAGGHIRGRQRVEVLVEDGAHQLGGHLAGLRLGRRQPGGDS